MRITRLFARSAAVFLAGALLAATANAQTARTVRVARRAVVVDTPRGDGLVLGFVEAGEVLDVVEHRDQWYQVNAPANATKEKPWRRGWIHESYLVGAKAQSAAQDSSAMDERPRPPGDRLIRGFGEIGGTIFLARNSFDTIFGSAVGPTYGGGGQLILKNGLLVEVSADRFAKTGSRALVSGAQVFRLGIPDKVTLMPVQATLGYRQATSKRVAGYAGAGAGWLAFKEETATPTGSTVKKNHAEYHLMGGGEFLIAPGLWTAGEIRWRTVPKGLGPGGVGTIFDESDLGGTTFLFKLLVGR